MNARECSLDTSVVIRLLVGAPLPQFRTASRFLEQRIAAGLRVLVSDLVLAEAYFALQSSYAMPKGDALALLAQFSAAAGVTTSGYVGEILALPNLARTNPGFVDRLIHAASSAAGSAFITFEKAAGKLPDTLVLE